MVLGKYGVVPVCEGLEWRGVIGSVGASLVGVHVGSVGACGGSTLFLWGVGGRGESYDFG